MPIPQPEFVKICSVLAGSAIAPGNFFITGPLPPNRLVGGYDIGLVALSFVIASVASFVALDMASQLRRDYSSRIKHFWHIGGAVAMGAGIWAMHFTGMLAYNMGMAHNYDVGITLLSLVLPICFSYVVLHLIKRGSDKRTLFLAAPFLGLSIVAMHYTGMAAMQMHAQLRYRPDWFLLSIVIAVTTSAAALWLAMRASAARPGHAVSFKLMSALVMGAAICGMHYVGMAAAVFIPVGINHAPDPTSETMNALLAVGIGAVTLLVLGLTLAALIINQKVAAHLKEQVEKRTEELEVARRNAEAANLVKGEFLANMSHEIRTPMNAVVGLAHILADTDPLTERQREFIRTLRLNADNLLALINDLLDFSKLEHGQIRLESVAFDLKEIAGRVVKMMGASARERGLEILLAYEDSLGRGFMGDSLRVQQILVNLVSNAVKFTEKGKVQVLIKQGPRQAVLLQIIDSGVGIAADKLETIFDKFTQADASVTRKYGGSGLGLAICKSLAEQMGGSIKVESQLGAGSVFTVTLPLPPAELLVLPSFSKTAFEPVATQKSRVLLVEDYPANILVAGTLLNNFGYVFDAAQSGQDALEKFQEKKYDLILMDVQMRDMDGLQVTRRIREIELEKNLSPVPIMAMTAHAMDKDRERCLESGMNDYISKPFDPQEFLQKIKQLLAASRNLPRKVAA